MAVTKTQRLKAAGKAANQSKADRINKPPNSDQRKPIWWTRHKALFDKLYNDYRMTVSEIGDYMSMRHDEDLTHRQLNYHFHDKWKWEKYNLAKQKTQSQSLKSDDSDLVDMGLSESPGSPVEVEDLRDAPVARLPAHFTSYSHASEKLIADYCAAIDNKSAATNCYESLCQKVISDENLFGEYPEHLLLECVQFIGIERNDTGLQLLNGLRKKGCLTKETDAEQRLVQYLLQVDQSDDTILPHELLEIIIPNDIKGKSPFQPLLFQVCDIKTYQLLARIPEDAQVSDQSPPDDKLRDYQKRILAFLENQPVWSWCESKHTSASIKASPFSLQECVDWCAEVLPNTTVPNQLITCIRPDTYHAMLFSTLWASCIHAHRREEPPAWWFEAEPELGISPTCLLSIVCRLIVDKFTIPEVNSVGSNDGDDESDRFLALARDAVLKVQDFAPSCLWISFLAEAAEVRPDRSSELQHFMFNAERFIKALQLNENPLDPVPQELDISGGYSDLLSPGAWNGNDILDFGSNNQESDSDWN